MFDLYSLFRPLLFAADPETAHAAAFKALDTAARLGIAQALAPKLPADPVTVMGITFPNRVGLAAGLDKNAEHLSGLSTLGFGFIEAGTVTPRPQPGNPKPRLFRIPEAEALINRMGFNNVGVERFVENVKRSAYRGILGINLGKNFDTPNERAADDYVIGLRAVYPHASYVTINISSPNTKGLRDLQSEEALAALLTILMRERDELANRHGRVVPLTVKIAPDLSDDAIQGVARRLVDAGVDGVIATNTTLSREGVRASPHADEAGGLSGRPLRERSNEVIRAMSAALGGALPIIGVGGVASGEDVRTKLGCGAALVQVYTALIYRGPDVVADMVRTVTAPRTSRTA